MELNELNLKIKVCGLVKNDKHRTKAIVDVTGKEISIDKKSNLFLLSLILISLYLDL